MPREVTINYMPPGPTAHAFQQSNAFVRGIRGPFGSGKSTLCAVEILRRALEQKPAPDGKRYSRFAITRNSYPELKTTTITTWHEIMPKDAGRWVDQGPPTHYLMTEDLACEILFLALDSPADVSKLLSMNLTGAWMNEAREQPKAILDGLTGRVGRFPPAAYGGPTWSGILMDTNPPDADHWWHTLAERDDSTPQNRKLIESMEEAERVLRKLKVPQTKQPVLAANQKLFEFFSQPGGLTEGAENVDVLPPGYYQKMMAGKTQAWIDIYVHGKYGFVLDGAAVYPEYNEPLHAKDIKPVENLPLHIGLDFGLTPAAVICQRLHNGAWRVHDEITSQFLGAIRFADELAHVLKERWSKYEIATITGDPAGNQPLGDDEEKTVFKVLAQAGVHAKPASSNDFTPRREAVAKMLTTVVDGEAMLQIGPRCHKLRKAMMGGYHYRRIQVTGDERYQNEPNKNEWSHVAEALQYAMLGAGEGKRVIRGAKRAAALQVESEYQLLG